MPTAIRESPMPADTATPVVDLPLPTLTLPPASLLPTSTPRPASGVQEGVRIIEPGGRILTPSAGRDRVLWVAPAGVGLGLYLYRLPTGQIQRLAEPTVAGGCVCRGYVRGDWVVMVETRAGAPWWEVSALHLVTGERTLVGRTEDPATLTALRPGEFAVNWAGLVVWKDVHTDSEGGVVETLRLHDVVTGAVSDLLQVRWPVQIGHVGMDGDWVVFHQATVEEAGVRGDVLAYNIRSDELFPIGETGRAWQPAIWGTTVVWKQADGPLAEGDVFLFDLETGQGRLLTDTGAAFEVGVGDGFVAWSSVLEGMVVRYDRAQDTREVIGRGPVGWLAVGENTIAWQLDDALTRLYVAWYP